MNNGNKYISWQMLVILLGILGTILGVLWNSMENLRSDVSVIKVDVATTKTQLEGLLDKIKGGKISIMLNGKQDE